MPETTATQTSSTLDLNQLRDKKIKALAKLSLATAASREGKILANPFELSDSDIVIGAPEFHYIARNVIKDSSKTSSTDASASLDLGLSFGHMGFNSTYHHDKHNSSKSDTSVFSLYISYPVRLRNAKKFLRTAISSGNEGDLEQLPNYYVVSGAIVAGFDLIIENHKVSEEENREFSLGGSIKLPSIIPLIEGQCKFDSDASSKSTSEAIKLQVRGVGGATFPPVTTANFKADLDKLIKKLWEQYETAQFSAKFLHAQSDVYFHKPKNPHAQLSTLIDELTIKLNHSIFPQARHYQEKLYKLKHEVLALNDDLKTIAKSFANLIIEMNEKGVCFLGHRYRIQFNKGLFFASAASGEHPILASKNNPGHFELVAMPGEKYLFAIKTVAGGQEKYLIARHDPEHLLRQPTCALAEIKDLQNPGENQSVLWRLEPDPQKSGFYFLTNGSYTFSTFQSGAGMRFCQVADMRGRQFVRLADDFFRDSLKAVNAVVDTGLAVTEKKFPLESKKPLSTSSEKSANSLKLMPILVHKILPKLQGSKNFPVTAFLGSSGAGKSTIINALLDHDFIINETVSGPSTKVRGKFKQQKKTRDDKKKNLIGLRVKDPSRTHAKMGASVLNSCTVYPEIFAQSLCDCPGFQDTKGKVVDELHAFTFALIREMTQSVKALVLVFNYANLTNRAFGEVIANLQSFFTVPSYKELQDNLVIVFNIKETLSSPAAEQNKSNRIYDTLKQFKADLEKDPDLSQILAAKNKPSPGQKKMGFLPKQPLTPEQKSKQEEIDILYQSHKLIKYMLSDDFPGFNIFHDPNSQEFRGELNEELTGIKTPIPKGYFRYSLTSDTSNRIISTLAEWLKLNHAPLIELDKQLAVARKDVATFRNEVGKNTLDKLQSRVNGGEGFDGIAAQLTSFSKQLGEFLSEIEFQDVKTAAQYRSGFLWAYPTLSVQPYPKDEGPFTRVKFDSQIGKTAFKLSSNKKITSFRIGGHRLLSSINTGYEAIYSANITVVGFADDIKVGTSVGKVYGLKLHKSTQNENYQTLISDIEDFCDDETADFDLKNFVNQCALLKDFAELTTPYNELKAAWDALQVKIDAETHREQYTKDLKASVDTMLKKVKAFSKALRDIQNAPDAKTKYQTLYKVLLNDGSTQQREGKLVQRVSQLKSKLAYRRSQDEEVYQKLEPLRATLYHAAHNSKSHTTELDFFFDACERGHDTVPNQSLYKVVPSATVAAEHPLQPTPGPSPINFSGETATATVTSEETAPAEQPTPVNV